MNIPGPDFDKPKLHELTSASIDGNANEAQLRELTEILRVSSAARDEYLALVDLHATLVTAPPAVSSRRSDVRDSSIADSAIADSAISKRRYLVPVALAASLAACLLFTVSLYDGDDPKETPKLFATLAQVTDAVWESGKIEVGNRVGPSTLQLKSGLVRLEFDSGVDVTLEGPAVFQLVNLARTELKSGLLTATVPAGAEGFTVDTPNAQVIDLGTSFGIDLSRKGFSSVSVFDGEVEVAPLDSAEPGASERLLVTEGESVRIGAGYAIENIGFDPKPFEKLWPFASGIAGSTETIRFVPPWPRRIRMVQSDDAIFARPEGRVVELVSDLNLNIGEPSEVTTVGDLSPATLDADAKIRSYILHYFPESQLGPRKAKRILGAITFERPVLGLIIRHEELLASSRRFGRRSAGEANLRRELNLTGDDSGDRITLSEDRRTVTLDLISPGRSSDLVRVIVDGTGGFKPPLRRKKNQSTDRNHRSGESR